MATLLPTAAFYLRLGRFAPARALVEAGAPVALASDVNPGGGLSPSLRFAMAIGCFSMGLALEEALAAVTLNAAFSLDLQDEVGSIEPGKRADLVLLRSPRLLDLVRLGVAGDPGGGEGRARGRRARRAGIARRGVSAGGPLRVRALSFHARYRCGHSGACCSSGWTIPVEPAVAARIDAGAASGELRAGDGSPAGDWARALPVAAAASATAARVALRTLPGGACVFFDARATRLCAVQLRLGEGALPSSCRHFPRVVTLTPLGVSVDALALLSDGGGAGGRRSCRARSRRRGAARVPVVLAVRGPRRADALPPSLRPGVLATWGSFERWEEDAVATLTRSPSPETALARARREGRACPPLDARRRLLRHLLRGPAGREWRSAVGRGRLPPGSRTGSSSRRRPSRPDCFPPPRRRPRAARTRG